jgi:hypothetical protein
MSGGIPVTITNAGMPVTNTVGGAPVTLTGGTAAAVTTGQVVSMEVNGTPDVDVTFTVVAGVITEITHA